MSRNKDIKNDVKTFLYDSLAAAREKLPKPKHIKALPIKAMILFYAPIFITGVVIYHKTPDPTSMEPEITEKQIDSYLQPVEKIIEQKQRNTPFFGCSQIIQERFDSNKRKPSFSKPDHGNN